MIEILDEVKVKESMRLLERVKPDEDGYASDSADDEETCIKKVRAQKHKSWKRKHILAEGENMRIKPSIIEDNKKQKKVIKSLINKKKARTNYFKNISNKQLLI